MDFSLDRIKNFPSSLSFLIDTVVQSGKYVYQQEVSIDKPLWLTQSEKFSSFFERVKHNEEALDKFKNGVVKPVYLKYELDFNDKIVGDDNKIKDSYLKILDDEDEDFKIKTPGGLFFKAEKFYLPFSEVYNKVKSLKKKNSPYPLLLLIGLYSTVYNAVRNQETEDTNMFFRDNIQVLHEGLEGCEGIHKKPVQNNPMDMLQNMMKNFDFSQLSDMMGKVTGDEKASKEFGEVFGKMTESIKKGENPLLSMGEIVKDISSKMEEEDKSIPVEEEVKEVKEVKEVEEVKEVVEEVYQPPLESIPEELDL